MDLKKKDDHGYKVAQIYSGLRRQVFTALSKSFQIDRSIPDFRGLLMETGYSEGICTLVVLADDTVSLYFSNGGGMIGIGQHEKPREAARDLLEAVPGFMKETKKTKKFPLPHHGHTRFYFLTKSGVSTAYHREDDLGNNRLPLSPLFHKAHMVIAYAQDVNVKK